jgi:hypothetical protein
MKRCVRSWEGREVIKDIKARTEIEKTGHRVRARGPS